MTGRRTALGKTALRWMAILFLAALLGSIGFILAHADHDCIGHHCPICEQIRICSEIFRKISHGLVSVFAFLSFVLTAFLSIHIWFRNKARQSSPVQLKVRLNN
jgi:hypothetical protein